MANWKRKIKIKYLLKGGRDDVSSQNAGKAVAEVLEKDQDEQIKTIAKLFKLVQNVDEFDHLMNTFYDYCDENLIWIE